MRTSGALIIAFASLLFAAAALCARVAANELTAVQLTLVRFFFGAVGCAVLFALRGERPNLTRPWLLVTRGVIGSATAMAFYAAIVRIGVGPATLLNYLYPVYGAIFARLFLKEHVSRAQLVGLVLATSGAAAVIFSTINEATFVAPALGAAFGMTSAVLGGVSTTAIKALRETTDAITIFFSFSVCGIALSLPPSLIDWHPVSSGAWLPVVAMALLSMGGQLLFTYGLKFTSTAAGGTAAQMTPVFALALGSIFLNETLAPLAIAGSALCIIGVLWGNLPRRVRTIQN